MALAPDVGTSTDPNPIEGDGQSIDAPGLNYFVFGLFFIFGGITSLNDVIIPKLKELFTLSWTEAMLVQFCFFAAYAIIGIPGAKLVKKLGYMRGAVAGLVTMMVGCLLFIPASQTATYGVFLFALFVLASGVVIVQVVANPLISLLGPVKTTHSRLTFAQAFNSLGTTIFPIVGAAIILGSLATVTADQLSGIELQQYRQAGSEAIWQGYLGLAVMIGIVALVVWMFRNRLKGEKHEASEGLAGFDLLKRSRFGFGALCIFLYVGGEVAIGSVIINYLSEARVLGQPESVIGWMIGLYWGGAMLGRFIGSYFLRIFSPGKILAFNAAGAILLIILSISTSGNLAAYSLLAVGLMNSIMFPTIFSLACEKLGPRAADGSGIINVAICGGAIVPLFYGVVADATGGNLAAAMIIPIICYAVIACFGLFARKPA
ncbi:sugar MFS transporter [Pontixanthobacter aestiaquae]|uniref:Glucose/galactose MFS transporter n=1 Tax=Pontixanthobacter aestiaquae TaxID=1509367 RepID=A0A844Z4P7_9SPHN|nr:sugar MFS transporter [Pontixanthobacter aestiaquae]MDN3647234.1 sugar MFS transporter [Pontixanthobacter aestiaquae]MXO81790.1 glucose/galactose MFS transporter [Pontixanthobacter aestiaquae]